MSGVSRSQDPASQRLERAILLALLGEERAKDWSCAELASELAAPTAGVEEAVRRLQGDGLVCHRDSRVCASRAARRLDELGLIAI